MKNLSHLFYHIAVIVLGAAIALSLPETLEYLSGRFLAFWSYAENERLFLVLLELAAAIVIILLFNYLRRTWKDRRMSRMAKSAGLTLVAYARGILARRRVKQLKERQGAGKDVLVMGSTGFRTFVDPEGDLHRVLQTCREAKIMLLDPLREGAVARAQSIPDPEVSPESFREQIIRSIDFLKGLKALHKNIKLKLYREMPLLKLAILGDYVCVRHYHTGLNVNEMPEYVFKHDSNPGGLYDPFYQYFLSRWRDPSIPEYELETDELVYRDRTGNEVKRERFNDVVMEY